jgi:class 3 adenylate cyclase
MFDAIGSHGGVVNQMIGDGLMAVFGAPLQLEHCAASAVAASLEMLALLEDFNHEREVSKKKPIRVGVGIATGEVVAGYTGTQKRATYTCIGETVNLAARLEAHTKETGRAILIDDSTRRAVSGRVPIDSLGEVRFRGSANAVEVFSVDVAGYEQLRP